MSVVDKNEFDEIYSQLSTSIAQFNELTENHQQQIGNLRENLQNWISLSDESDVDEIMRSISEHFVAQDEKRRQVNDNESQTIHSMGMIDASIETNRTFSNDCESQVDPIRTAASETQTESLQELLSMVKTTLLSRLCFLHVSFFFLFIAFLAKRRTFQ